MNIVKVITFSVLSLCLFLGCATGSLSQTPFSALPEKKDQAVIYIYRPEVGPNSLNLDVPIFYINDIEIGPLQMSGYYPMNVNPGVSEIYFTYNGLFGTKLFQIKQSEKLSIEAGKSYFIRLSSAGLAGTEYKLILLSREVALKEIQSMKLMIPKFSMKDL